MANLPTYDIICPACQANLGHFGTTPSSLLLQMHVLCIPCGAAVKWKVKDHVLDKLKEIKAGQERLRS